MIRKLPDGRYRLYSMKKDPKTGKRRNLGTFKTKEAAKKHEQEAVVVTQAGRLNAVTVRSAIARSSRISASASTAAGSAIGASTS